MKTQITKLSLSIATLLTLTASTLFGGENLIKVDTNGAKNISVCSRNSLDERRVIIKDNLYGLTFPTFLLGGDSELSYCAKDVDKLGAIFRLDYKDTGRQETSPMDGYPSGIIGGMSVGGKWRIGNKSQTGMPVKLAVLGKKEKIIVEWKVSQENAYDQDDVWQATINCIFGSTRDQQPVGANRDFDLVIQSDTHQFNKGFTDKANRGENREPLAYFFARKKGKILPFSITIDGKKYRYAVRYKIFHSGDKENKIHVKYIPLNKANTPRTFKYDIQKFIKNSKKYLKYTALKQYVDEIRYANYKDTLAKRSLYLKAIAGGYEVYEGESILKNDMFRVRLVDVK